MDILETGYTYTRRKVINPKYGRTDVLNVPQTQHLRNRNELRNRIEFPKLSETTLVINEDCLEFYAVS